MVVFDYKGYIQDIKSREEGLRQSAPKISSDNLFALTGNIFADFYSEYLPVFENPENTTYYRLEVCRASGYKKLDKRIFIPLPPFGNPKEFVNYFLEPVKNGERLEYRKLTEAQNLAIERIEDGTFLPLFLDPQSYLTRDVERIYRPVFQALNRKGFYPPYANRVEDALAIHKHGGLTWEELKELNRSELKAIGEEKIRIGSLPEQRADAFIGERISWLQLIGRDSDVKDLKEIALDSPQNAGKVAFTCHALYTAPLFYARRTTMCFSESDRGIFTESCKRLIEFKMAHGFGDHRNDDSNVLQYPLIDLINSIVVEKNKN